MKQDIIEKIPLLLTAISGIVLLLIQGEIIDQKLLPPAVVIGAISLGVEAIWKIFVKPGKQAKQAEDIINSSFDGLLNFYGKNHVGKIRANIMVSKGICPKKLYIKYMSKNMKAEADRDVVLEKWEGCAGQAWAVNLPLAANLHFHSDVPGYYHWILSPENERKTKDLKVLVSCPITHPKKASKVIGVLNVDSKDSECDFLLDDDSIENIKAFAILTSELLENLGQL